MLSKINGKKPRQALRTGGSRWGKKGEEGVDYTYCNEILRSFADSICGYGFLSLLLFLMKIIHLKVPVGPISWHLIRVCFSPLDMFSVILDPSVLGHD